MNEEEKESKKLKKKSQTKFKQPQRLYIFVIQI